MNVTDFQEVWQIDAGGQIYEAKFEEMAQWVFEGSLLPQDMVRRGNLRWIEARKVPALLKFFNDRDQGLPPPVFASTTDAQAPLQYSTEQPQNFPPQQAFSPNSYQTTIKQPPANNFQPSQNPFDTPPSAPNFQNQTAWQEPAFSRQEQSFNEPPPHEFNLMPTADFCSMHSETPAAFLCGTCGNGFCPACPKSYGGTVKICPFCGAMCKSVKEVQQKTQAAFQYSSDISKGFGFDDFFNALAYPFKFKTSLIVGAIMFMFFSLGQGAASMGNIFLTGAGLISLMLSNTLTFGVLANTVENFAQGKVGGNFMPSFDDFSLWDDVVHPFFLSIGVYLVSFGLVIVTIIVIIVWGLNQISNGITESYNPQKAPIVRNDENPYAGDPNFQQPGGYDETPTDRTFNNAPVNPTSDPAQDDELEKANKVLREIREQEYESARRQVEPDVSKIPEAEPPSRLQAFDTFKNAALPVLILLLIGTLWGIFYFPAACCVAGYTRSFVATMNPTVGLETIKLLGWDYVKLWFMGLIILFLSFIVGLILGVVFMAFDMPMIGNIPAKVIGAMFGFYFSVVFSVILGFALYKNADRLNLFKG